MERSQDWMDAAVGDLEHARSDRERGFHNWACFSSQQSAEKAVKAVFRPWNCTFTPRRSLSEQGIVSRG